MLLELGRAEARAGDPEAIGHLEQAMEAAEDGRDAAHAALELAPVLKFAGEAVRAVAVIERALERLDGADPALAEQLEVELVGSAYISIAARRLLAPRLAALPDPPSVPRTYFDRFRLTGLAFDAFAAGRPADEVADLATRGLAYGAMATDPTAGGHVFVSGAIALMFAEHYDEADRLYSGALEDARRRGSGIAFATASSLRSLVAYRRGRLADAQADAAAALELAGDVHGSQGFLSAALGTLIYTALDQGTVDGALEAFADRFVREQAVDSLPYSHAMHSRACLRVAPRRARSGLSGAAGDRPARARVGRAQPRGHALALDRRAGRVAARGRGRGAGAGLRGGRDRTRVRRAAGARGGAARGRSRRGREEGFGCSPRPWPCSSARSARSNTPAR